MNKIYYLFFLVLFFSCGEEKSNIKTEAKENVSEKSIHKLSIDHSFLNGNIFDTNDDFDFIIKQIKVAKAINVEYFKNQYYEDETDTVKTYQFGESEIKIYYGNKIFLVAVDIRDTSLRLLNGISFGDRIEKIFSLFDLNNEKNKECDILEINSTEGATNTLQIFFKEGLVSQIYYSPYLD